MEGLGALIWEAGPHDQIAMGKSSVMENGGGAGLQVRKWDGTDFYCPVLSTRSRSQSYIAPDHRVTHSPRGEQTSEQELPVGGGRRVKGLLGQAFLH